MAARTPHRWQETKWGNLATLEYGKSLRDYDEKRSEHKPYRVFGTNGPIGWHSLPLCERGSVVVGRKGAYRGIHFSPDPFFVIDTAFYLKPKTDFDIRWAYYQLKDFDINKLDSGSAIPSTSREAFYEIPVSLPPLPMQRRIAGILSAYDDLIANNERRIKILEEMTRSLYREWFVHFRFQGHDKVEYCETQFGKVPLGWTVPFADYVDFKEGPGLRNWQYRDSGVPFLNIRTLVDNDIDFSKVQFIDENEAQDRYQHFLLREHDHVVSSSGTIGRLVTIRAEHLPLMLNTSIIRMRPQGRRIGRWQLKHFLLSDYFQSQAKSFAIGAAQPNFGPSHLKEMRILAPSEEIGVMYERLVAPMELAIMSLACRITNLRRTRDLLLPRLLSGQINVNSMDAIT